MKFTGFGAKGTNVMTSNHWRDVIFLVFGHVILHTLYIKKYVMGILDWIEALSCDKNISWQMHNSVFRKFNKSDLLSLSDIV